MVDAIVLMAEGQLAQLPGAPRQPIGERSRQCFGGGLFLQGLGVSEEPGGRPPTADAVNGDLDDDEEIVCTVHGPNRGDDQDDEDASGIEARELEAVHG
ncbi:hypothetical protein ACFV1U_26575 [Streptomyces microflavus]|uniref:hypothetical protein n=1 Tax=Streptomyces microflavus TaxID=1919 RepID=UPI00367530BC